MPHISYSELKNWVTCPFYHKLTYIDKIKAFRGNEYTAFGSALHRTCEKIMLEETKDPSGYFLETFANEIDSLDGVDIRENLVEDMEGQGFSLAPLAIPALKEYFGDFTIVSIEEELYEAIDESLCDADFNFKGFIDLVVKTSDGKYHIIDWKTCSWGWDSRKKSEKLITYQLTLYKHFFCQKHKIDPKSVETHFALLKRTATKNRVEIFRVSSGKKKTENALKLLYQAIYNISKQFHIKNRLACQRPYRCQLYQTEYCK